jgi:hypothetical protein
MTQSSNPNECPLPLAFFCKKFGISRTTCWRWQRLGLPVVQVGAKKFARESDFVAFLESGGKPRASEGRE